MTTYLLNRQIDSLKEKLVKEGGWSENIFQHRLAQRNRQRGFTLIELLIVLAILIITAVGGKVMWENKTPVVPTSTPTQPQPSLPHPTPTTVFPTVPQIDEVTQPTTQCTRESGIDTCPTGYLCYWSWTCPKGIENCGPPTGDSLCHKECQTNSDCPPSMPVCREVALMRGDYGNFFHLCMP